MLLKIHTYRQTHARTYNYVDKFRVSPTSVCGTGQAWLTTGYQITGLHCGDRCTNTQTSTKYVRTLKYAHAHTHQPKPTNRHTHKDKCTHIRYTQIRPQILLHVCTYTHAYIHARTCTYTYTQTHTCRYSCTHTEKQSRRESEVDGVFSN